MRLSGKRILKKGKLILEKAVTETNYDRFKNLTFEGFKKLALDPALSPYEKIGFPNTYRAGKEKQIFLDVTAKLKNLRQKNKVVIDIGSGCSELPLMLI